jgi:hypothetical protein
MTIQQSKWRFPSRGKHIYATADIKATQKPVFELHSIIFMLENNMTKRPQLLDAQECAVLLLLLLASKYDGRLPATRVRLSELTLKRLWGRSRISRQLLEEIQEWVIRGGWALFWAGGTFAAVKTSAVLSWSRLSSKRIAEDLRQVAEDRHEFEKHWHLIDGVQVDED